MEIFTVMPPAAGDPFRQNGPADAVRPAAEPRRIMVIGCPGGGKTTFSIALHGITGIPLIHLDRMYWNADRTTVDKQVFRERLAEALRAPAWIVDGNYGSTMEMRLQACDAVFFLDYPTDVCLAGVRERRGRPRPDLPWTETGEDEDFIAYIRDFAAQSRPKITALLERYAEKEIRVFKSRAEGDAFLAALRRLRDAETKQGG